MSPQALRGSTPAAQLQATLQDTFSCIEQYWEGGVHSIGPAHLFFQLLDDFRESLPVSVSLPLHQWVELGVCDAGTVCPEPSSVQDPGHGPS